MKNIVLSLLSLIVLVPLAASAKPYHLTSVRWIVDTRNNIDVDDHYVTIVGHVTRRISDEEYWFTDGTGQIRLDSENFDLPIGKRIVIGGRIDQAYLGFGHIEVDVRKWHYAPLRQAVVVAHPMTHAATPAHVEPPAPAPVVDRAPTPTPAAPSLAPAPEPAPAVSTPIETNSVSTSTVTTSNAAPVSASVPVSTVPDSQPAAVTNGAPVTPPAATN